MIIKFFSAKHYDREFFEANNRGRFNFQFLEVPLQLNTVALAKDADAVCIFVNDQANKEVLEMLAKLDVKLVALRCAGYNQVDMETAKALNLPIVRVPAYSPYAVAEHTVAFDDT